MNSIWEQGSLGTDLLVYKARGHFGCCREGGREGEMQASFKLLSPASSVTLAFVCG